MTTPQDLLAAYVRATKLPVRMSYIREQALSKLVEIGITPEEVAMVCEELQKLIKRDTKGIYTPACLEFRRVCGDPDRMEERVLTIRQRKLRTAPPKAQETVVREVGKDKVVFLSDVQPPEPARANVKAALVNLANQIKTA